MINRRGSRRAGTWSSLVVSPAECFARIDDLVIGARMAGQPERARTSFDAGESHFPKLVSRRCKTRLCLKHSCGGHDLAADDGGVLINRVANDCQLTPSRETVVPEFVGCVVFPAILKRS